jgi:prepilin-type N-terminal cleavage/methylation domain-containing protein
MSRATHELHIRDDCGFTLVELVIAMMILGLIMVPLLSSFVLNISSASESNQRVQDSLDAQVLSTYFTADVASSNTVAISAASPPCGYSGTGQLVIELMWADSGGANPQYVAYVATDVSTTSEADLHAPAAVYELERLTCTNPAGPIVSSQPMARALRVIPSFAAFVGGVPNLSCDGQSCASAIAPGPHAVALTTDEYGQPTDAAHDYIFTVTGTRRVTG